jgi:hypothetical protein
MGLEPIHKDFGHTRSGVIVRTHAETVGSRGTDRQQIPFGNGKLTILAEKITGFADRTYYIIAV